MTLFHTLISWVPEECPLWVPGWGLFLSKKYSLAGIMRFKINHIKLKSIHIFAGISRNCCMHTCIGGLMQFFGLRLCNISRIWKDQEGKILVISCHPTKVCDTEIYNKKSFKVPYLHPVDQSSPKFFHILLGRVPMKPVFSFRQNTDIQNNILTNIMPNTKVRPNTKGSAVH